MFARLRDLFTQRVPQRLSGQGLVEFGLSVAAVAFVAMLGFHALGGAQAAYWGGPVQQTLAQPTPVTGDFVHPTQLTGTCTPTSFVALTAYTLSCNVTVTDMWNKDRVAPRGQVQILIDSNPLPTVCTLVPAASGQPFSTCPGLTESWTPQMGDVGSHTVYGQYTPDPSTDLGKHAASSLTPLVGITVTPPWTVAFTPDAAHTTACWNPYPSLFSGYPEKFEIGHPEICHVTVKDGSGQRAPDATVQVTESVSGGPPGTTYFSCYTNGSVAALATCSNPSPTFIGVTGDGSAGRPTGEMYFVYRRYYDSLVNPVNVSLTATVTSTPGNPPTSAPETIVVQPPSAGPHRADMIIDCPSAAVTQTTQQWLAGSGQTVTSVKDLQGSPGSLVTCTVVMFDTDQAFFSGGNPDNEDLYTPFGTITWVDGSGTPIMDQNNNPATCTLDPSQGTALPAFKPMQYHGLPSDAGGCQTTLRLSGALTVQARYTPIAAPHLAHQPVYTHNTFTAQF